LLRAETQLHLDRFLRTVAKARRSLLLLDYDGTLAPFHEDRDQAFPHPGIPQVLREIVRNGHTRVVIVSGRDASEIGPLLGIAPIPEVWGLHGLQRKKPGGSVETVRIRDRWLAALSDADRWLGYQRVQHKAEFKTGSIAAHWRGLSEFEVDELRGRVLLGWSPIAERSGLELLDFDGGVEIRVPEVNKGDVVRRVLSEMEVDTPAAYLGDDITDERAFRAISGRGLSVLVRPSWRQTAAQLWLKPPEELLDFLTRWLEAVGRGTADGKATGAAIGP
jgi:trehalose 6-phosphate phosphatase